MIYYRSHTINCKEMVRMIQYGIFECECEARWPDEIHEWDEDYQQRCPNCAYDVDERPKLVEVLVSQ